MIHSSNCGLAEAAAYGAPNDSPASSADAAISMVALRPRETPCVGPSPGDRLSGDRRPSEADEVAKEVAVSVRAALRGIGSR